MERPACIDSSPFISLITGLILIEPQRTSELLCRTAFKHITSISVCVTAMMAAAEKSTLLEE